MKASIIIIGDEILLGKVTDTNSGAIARVLDPAGWQIGDIVTVGDEREEIAEAVARALKRSQLVITTGGLGPTKDDITKGVLTDIFGGELCMNHDVTENIRRVFALRGLTLNPLTEAQALVPSSCRVIQNRYGTAPIMWFEKDGKVLVSMPGVPFETEGMLPEVAAAISERFTPDSEVSHASVMVTGITESALATRLEGYEASLPTGLHLAYLPQPGLIHLRIDGIGAKGAGVSERVAEAHRRLLEELGDLAILDHEATAAQLVIEVMKRRGLTVATAESCTGGNIAHRLTMVPGSSEVYVGSIVSYANDVKINVLGVKAEDIEREGAVSREVVEQMAQGALRVTGAECAVATSGIAGPGGGSAEKPVGTVWMAWATATGTTSQVFKFPGNRSRVIDRASTEALLGLLKLT